MEYREDGPPRAVAAKPWKTAAIAVVAVAAQSPRHRWEGLRRRTAVASSSVRPDQLRSQRHY